MQTKMRNLKKIIKNQCEVYTSQSINASFTFTHVYICLEWPWKGNESCDFLSRYKISFDEHDLCAVVKMKEEKLHGTQTALLI